MNWWLEVTIKLLITIQRKIDEKLRRESADSGSGQKLLELAREIYQAPGGRKKKKSSIGKLLTGFEE